MIEGAERDGVLTKEKVIVESSSGNTGIGLAMVGAMKGYKVLVTMSERASCRARADAQNLGSRGGADLGGRGFR